MKRMITKIALATVVSATAASAAYADWVNPWVPDGTQLRQSRAIAGAAPNSTATFIDGVRCSYIYQYQQTAQGRVKVRVPVCN
ncbi:MAG: hypothetical protein LJE67_11140 [Salaquimonas sp.]|jgi:hypothetical protein|nr:hypothetical protein [Salaquimonas sp.]